MKIIHQFSSTTQLYSPHVIVITLTIVLGILPTTGRDVKAQKEKYLPDYSVYHNLSRIQSDIESIAARNPQYMKLDTSYLSRQGRPQLLLHVTNFSDSQRAVAHPPKAPKVKVLLSYGEHAREFLPVESLFYLLENITSGLTSPMESPAYLYSSFVLSKVELFIVGIVNPDGRRFVEQTANYCWRGTSTGVDLNRNFDWHFGDKGSSADMKDEEYRGTHPFSEPECAVLIDVSLRYRLDAFISLHSGIKQIYVPFADTHSKRLKKKPENLERMLDLAELMSKSTSHPYSYGVAYQLNEYTADGTTFDYMAGVRKVPFSLAVELWGMGDHEGAKCFDLFNPENHELKNSLQEIHPLYEKVFTYLVKWKEDQTVYLLDPSRDAPPLTLGYVLLACLVVITLVVAVHSKLPACMRLYPRRRVISLRSLSSTFSLTNVLNIKL